jgi:hypothetical protein
LIFLVILTKILQSPMNKALFKNISYPFFPFIAQKERTYFVYNNIILYFHNIVTAKNDADIEKLYDNYQNFVSTLTQEEEQEFADSLQAVKELMYFSMSLVENPLKYANDLNKKINTNTDNINLPKMCLQCACASIIATCSNTLSELEKNQQFIIQQDRLNIAIQNNWEAKNTVNYWYALHFYLQNNMKNTMFFIKNLLQNPSPYDIELMLDKQASPWLKNKIPEGFHEFVLKQYQEWLLSQEKNIEMY